MKEAFFMNNKKITLFNIFFPIWMILFFPPIIFATLGINFIVDSFVILLTVYRLKIDASKDIYKSSILKVWGFGFLADIISALLLLGTNIIVDKLRLDTFSVLNTMTQGIFRNPFSHILSLLYMLLIITISGLLIYLFNKKFVFNDMDIEQSEMHIICLSLAIITAPWTFLLPSSLIY